MLRIAIASMDWVGGESDMMTATNIYDKLEVPIECWRLQKELSVGCVVLELPQ